MVDRWDKGRAVVDQLLTEGKLERVTPSAEHAAELLQQATTHLRSAAVLAETDPGLAFAGAYDAARKALTAVLAVQGLRPTSAGGHVVVLDAALAQLEPPLGKVLKPFNWMRRTRNQSEYPAPDAPAADADDVREASGYAQAILDAARVVVDQLPPYGR